MGQIDSGSKSNRLLASRRYTHNTFNTAQESFTNVLDLRSEEIYTRAHLIPSSSLPHSGSSQKMAIFTKNGQNVTKYWYRHKLTKSNTNNEVWFFLNPTGSNSGVGAQLINDNQEVNFISPKYGTSALANTTAEDSTPGYLAVVYKSTATNTSSLGGGDIVSTNDYQFDYKTGVLQFKSGDDDPTDSQYLYMSVYQYVGQNLRTGLEVEGPFTASNVSFTGESDISSFGSDAKSMISGSWRGWASQSAEKIFGGSVRVTGDIIAENYIVSSSITSMSIAQASGSTAFGDSIDDTHQFTGSLSVTGSLNLTGGITEDGVTHAEKFSYLRKQYVKKASSITVPATASFSAVTASSPSGITATNEDDFIFFLNGQYMEHDALIIQQAGSTFKLLVDNSSIGYDLESDDEIIAWGKFNS